jgi:hypothetical protein
MFQYTQPKKITDIKSDNDCMIRSVSLVTDTPYDVVHNVMYSHGWRASRRNSKGRWEDHILKSLNNIGYKATKISFPAKKNQERMNGETICKQYPEGVFLLRMSHHLSCLKDGVIYDTFDCSFKCVYFAWKIEKKLEHLDTSSSQPLFKIHDAEYLPLSNIPVVFRRRDNCTINLYILNEDKVEQWISFFNEESLYAKQLEDHFQINFKLI